MYAFDQYSHILFFSQDWNHLLASFSQFYLCEKTNASSFLDVSSVPPTPMKQENDHSTSVGSTVALLHLRVPLAVTTSSPSGSLKDFGLLTTLTASQLHLGGWVYNGAVWV